MDISRTAEVRKTVEDLFENILAEELEDWTHAGHVVGGRYGHRGY